MYSTCLFCKGALGKNESVEEFPVGRRLAFDSEKGRLWVVCPSCQRWNLTPIEQRWEAIEQCERLFRGQPLRAQTDNIGLAKLKEGTELVRIGHALRPEFAAWRYGRIFGRRLRRRLVLAGGGTAAVAATAVVGGAPLITAFAAFPPLALILTNLFILPALASRGRFISTRVVGEDGKILRVFAADLDHTRLLGGEGDDPWRLLLRHSYGRQELTGEHARRALGAILARVNRGGAGSGTVADATSLVADAGAPEQVAALVARDARRRTGDFDERWADYQRHPFKLRSRRKGEMFSNQPPTNPGALPRLPGAQRLALEMALHEGSEQAALEGQLALLEAAWREAEEIASIADNLLTPASTQQFIQRHRANP